MLLMVKPCTVQWGGCEIVLGNWDNHHSTSRGLQLEHGLKKGTTRIGIVLW